MKSPLVLACSIACALAALPAAQAAHRKSPHAAAPALTAAAVNDAATAASVGPGASGAATLRAAILLDRAHYSPGEIDARYGSNLRRAVLGYQAAHGLTASGVVDAATWKALDADIAPAVMDYTLTDADVAGPYAALPSDIMERAKLPALGYVSELEALGERFHASPQLLQKHLCYAA